MTKIYPFFAEVTPISEEFFLNSLERHKGKHLRIELANKLLLTLFNPVVDKINSNTYLLVGEILDDPGALLKHQKYKLIVIKEDVIGEIEFIEFYPFYTRG